MDSKKILQQISFAEEKALLSKKTKEAIDYYYREIAPHQIMVIISKTLSICIPIREQNDIRAIRVRLTKIGKYEKGMTVIVGLQKIKL